MEKSKIQLSEEELLLMQNRDWILTKNGIIEKVCHLFGNLSVQMQLLVQEHAMALPATITQSSPKISKGERYENLPYVVLDYPRSFSKENVFAIRTFFWWGNYFSMTLHMKGNFQEDYCDVIAQTINSKKLPGIFISMEGNEFDFNLAHSDFTKTDADTQLLPHAIANAPFFKIVYREEFRSWNMLPQQLVQHFAQLINMVAR